MVVVGKAKEFSEETQSKEQYISLTEEIFLVSHVTANVNPKAKDNNSQSQWKYFLLILL